MERRAKMKKKVIFSLVAILLLGISGCGKQEVNSSKTSKSKISFSSSKVKESTTEASSSRQEILKNTEKNEMSEVQELLKENTEAEKMTTLFEKGEPIINSNDQVSFTINGYQYIKIENFSRNFRTLFGDQVKEGGVLLVSATYKNNSDKSVYASPSFSMSVVGYDSSVGRNADLLGEDLVSELVKKKNEIKPNEEISGYVGLAIKPAAMEKILETGTATFNLSGLYSKANSFNKEDAIVEPKKEVIALSDEGSSSKSASSEFYEDKVTKDNMGTKTMIQEKELGKTEKFEEVDVTVEGYQVSSFEPNEDQAARFSKFDSGVVLLTVKLNVKNEGEESLDVDSTYATLTIGNKVKMMSENMLEVDTGANNIGKGSNATKYLVFLLDKETYEKLYKNQNYLLNVNLYNTKSERITTSGDLSIELSTP